MCICYEVSNQQITLKTVEAFASKLSKQAVVDALFQVIMGSNCLLKQ